MQTQNSRISSSDGHEIAQKSDTPPRNGRDQVSGAATQGRIRHLSHTPRQVVMAMDEHDKTDGVCGKLGGWASGLPESPAVVWR